MFQVLLECAGLHQPLFVVQGSCQGIEISLDSDAIPFGAVVKKSSSSRNVIMNNTGDIGAKLVLIASQNENFIDNFIDTEK